MSYYVIVRGPMGSGKTTLARLLAKRLRGRYVSVDALLRQEGLDQQWEGGYIAQKSFLRANALLAPAAKKLLREGKPVVVDGNFYWTSQVRDLERLLRFPHVVFTLRAPLAVCLARERARGHAHGEDAVRAVFRKAARVRRGIGIDANRSVARSVGEMVAFLRKRGFLRESI
ncbi:MAG: ATP-binding protein [Candidatus Aenigmarchaeota archaeon]|nr:ATP-binding protein [Candidatus Aenigmarchaeota archaeon]